MFSLMKVLSWLLELVEFRFLFPLIVNYQAILFLMSITFQNLVGTFLLSQHLVNISIHQV